MIPGDPDAAPAGWNPLPVVLADNRESTTRGSHILLGLMRFFLAEPLVFMLCFWGLHANHSFVPLLSFGDAILFRIVLRIAAAPWLSLELLMERYTVKKEKTH